MRKLPPVVYPIILYNAEIWALNPEDKLKDMIQFPKLPQVKLMKNLNK